jgi:hypothetical protein
MIPHCGVDSVPLHLTSCHHATLCIESFFNFAKYSSVTAMLSGLGLPSFNTVLLNYRFGFERSLLASNNVLVKLFSSRIAYLVADGTALVC